MIHMQVLLRNPNMTKADIVQTLVNQNGYTKKQAFDFVETMLELIKSDLAQGNDVLISGFGKFNVRDKAVRLGRNPSTGKALMLDARRVVTFKCGKLREKVNV
jgi:integration host factor subunit alpha